MGTRKEVGLVLFVTILVFPVVSARYGAALADCEADGRASPWDLKQVRRGGRNGGG